MSNSTKAKVLQNDLNEAAGTIQPSQSNSSTSPSKRPFWGRRILPACAYDVIIAFWIANCILGVFYFWLGDSFLKPAGQTELTILIFLARDFALEGRAGGKYLLGLQIIDKKSGKPPSIGQSVVRNIVLTGPILLYLTSFHLLNSVQFPNFQIVFLLLKFLVITYLAVVAIIEIVLMVRNKGQRIGDILAGTIVIQRS